MGRMMMEVTDAVAGSPVQMSAEGYYELGLTYASGRSMPIDRVTAHKWFNVALLMGFRDAAQRRAELAEEMSKDEIAAALREARAFVTRH